MGSALEILIPTSRLGSAKTWLIGRSYLDSIGFDDSDLVTTDIGDIEKDDILVTSVNFLQISTAFDYELENCGRSCSKKGFLTRHQKIFSITKGTTRKRLEVARLWNKDVLQKQHSRNGI